MPSFHSRNNTIAIVIKICAEAVIKVFCSCQILLDFFTLFQMFCPVLLANCTSFLINLCLKCTFMLFAFRKVHVNFDNFSVKVQKDTFKLISEFVWSHFRTVSLFFPMKTSKHQRYVKGTLVWNWLN